MRLVRRAGAFLDRFVRGHYVAIAWALLVFASAVGLWQAQEAQHRVTVIETRLGSRTTTVVRQGPTGPRGVDGARGPRGRRGRTGERGPRGSHGANGPRGPAGERGRTGAQGDRGPQGEQGPRGPLGPIGPVGPVGPIPSPEQIQQGLCAVAPAVCRSPR